MSTRTYCVRASPDLLDGNAPEDTIDQPSVIIGKGKLGTALFQMGMGEDLVLGRGEPIPDTLPYSSGKGEGGGDGEEERGRETRLTAYGNFPFFQACAVMFVHGQRCGTSALLLRNAMNFF